jgi:hypothetical protein
MLSIYETNLSKAVMLTSPISLDTKTGDRSGRDRSFCGGQDGPPPDADAPSSSLYSLVFVPRDCVSLLGISAFDIFVAAAGDCVWV